MNQTLLKAVEAAIAQACTHAHISRYLPNLENERPAQCLLIYVTEPTAERAPAACITVETPVEISARLASGLKAEEIRGIFPLSEPDEAVCLLEWILDEQAEEGDESESEEA